MWEDRAQHATRMAEKDFTYMTPIKFRKSAMKYTHFVALLITSTSVSTQKKHNRSR